MVALEQSEPQLGSVCYNGMVSFRVGEKQATCRDRANEHRPLADSPMDRDDALHIIRQHMPDLRRHHVKSLAIFGSVARNEAIDDSDVDILVEFSRPVGLFEFVRLQRFLGTILGCPIDLATPDALRPSMRAEILGEAVYA